jgi:hypothetical protein
MPNSFKPSPRLSFEVSNVPLSKGRAMTTGPVVNLHLGSPERGDVTGCNLSFLVPDCD